jgi:DNA-binding XRE family transcriptional regulator
MRTSDKEKDAIIKRLMADNELLRSDNKILNRINSKQREEISKSEYLHTTNDVEHSFEMTAQRVEHKESVEENHSFAQKKHVGKRVNLKKEHKEEISRLKQEHESEKLKMQQEFDAEKYKVQEDFKNDLLQAIEKLENENQEMRQLLKNNVNNTHKITAEIQGELAEIIDISRKKIKSLEAENSVMKKDLDDSLSITDKLMREMKSLDNEMKEKNEKLESENEKIKQLAELNSRNDQNKLFSDSDDGMSISGSSSGEEVIRGR